MINVQFFQLFCMFEKFLNEMFGGKKKLISAFFSVRQFQLFEFLSCPRRKEGTPRRRKLGGWEEALIISK